MWSVPFVASQGVQNFGREMQGQESNMEQMGFDADYCEFWGDFDESYGRLRGVLNRYMTGWSIYGLAEADWQGLAQVIDEHESVSTRLQDNPGGIDSLCPYLSTYEVVRVSEEEMMALDADSFQPEHRGLHFQVRRAARDDLEQLVDLYSDAGTMARTRAAVERPLCDLRVWIAENDGVIHAAAMTNAEIDQAAMIGGVYTRPDSRGQGMGEAVCYALCNELLQEEKQPVLYWETPAAGAVYRRLGFYPIGVWRSVWLRRR